MNRKEYNSDPRYAKVLETMDLLGIMDITTTRQSKNGTIIWKLPIKINYPGNKERLIEVGSFSTGYVRNQNSGYSNYQLNKRCQNEPEYFKDYKTIWHDNGEYTQKWTGKYRKFETRGCVLIPVEIDRLEYLLKYCIKNYFIKHANQVANGDFYPKWMYENKCGENNKAYNDGYAAAEVDYKKPDNEFISRSEHRKLMQEQYVNGRQGEDLEVKVIVNGQRYNII